MSDGELRQYDFLIAARKAGKRLNGMMVNHALDLTDMVKMGMVLGYHDAKKTFHKFTKEDSPGDIIKNAVAITVYMPTGTVTGPLYLTWRGGAYYLEKEKIRMKILNNIN